MPGGKMWWPVYLSVVSVFTLCSWMWGVSLHSREVITTQVEVSVVQRVNITRAGRVTVGHVVPTFMLDLYRQYNSRGRLPAADVIRSFMPKNTASLLTRGLHLPGRPKERRHLLIFEVPAPGVGEILGAAELRVLTINQKSSMDVGRPVTVSLLDDDNRDIATQQGNHQDSWITFNVTSSVMRCKHQRRMTLRLVVRLMGDGDLVVGVVADVQPLLLLSYFMTKNLKSRVVHHQKRSTEPGDYEEETNQLWDNDMITARLAASPQNLKSRVVHRHQKRSTEPEDYEEETNQLWDDDMITARLAASPQNLKSRVVHHQKRSTEPEDYEEETNQLWDDDMITARLAASSGTTNRKIRRMRNMCRRRPLYVDFSVIHYDSWIVAPNGYEAFQCMGKCFFPVGEHLTPTKHAIVQTLLHSVSPGSVGRACCVPTRLEPISVLYIDHRGVLTYRFSYQDMVVAECGCR